MARIEGVSDQEATPALRAVFDKKKKQNPHRKVPDTARIHALWPGIQKAVQDLREEIFKGVKPGRATQHSRIKADLLYLVYLRVAKLNRDAF